MSIRAFVTTIIFSVACLPAFAEENIDKTCVKNQALKVAKEYANSIACNTSIEKKNLIALRSWNTDDAEDRGYAKYALVWHGDIGCNGGSGTTTWNISIIKIGVGDYFFVDAAKSSPMGRVQLPVKPDIKIVKFSESNITVQTKVEDKAVEGRGCCEWTRVELQLKIDKNGNWNLANKKKL